jgi:hypothetical protein
MGGDEGRPCVCFGKSAATASAGGGKLCCVCGKDVAHEKRLKDDRGYWCMSCHRADQVRHAKKAVRQTEKIHVPCQECGRMVGEEGLTEYEGVRICRRCLEDRRALPKHRKYRPVASSEFERYERTRLLILVGVLVVLMLVILWSRLFS